MFVVFVGQLTSQIQIERPNIPIPILSQIASVKRFFPPWRELIAAMARCLCECIQHLSRRNRRSRRSYAEEFFEVCFAYLQETDFPDELFTNAFSFLSPKSSDTVLVMIHDFIVQYFAQAQVGQPYFWFNIMAIISQILKKG
jgi:hypothetical protein